jgi:hypothetical protein
MSVRTLVEIETVIVDYLKHHDDVQRLVNDRVSSDLKPTHPVPCLTVVLTGGEVIVERHLSGPTVEVNAWAEQREKARELGYTAHAALVEMIGSQREHRGVVTGVQTLTHPRHLDDPAKNRERYSFEIKVWTRPVGPAELAS